MGTNLQRVCLSIIEEIYNCKFLNEIMENYSCYLNLSNRDKSLVNMTILTLLRRNGEVELIIKKFLKKPLKHKHNVIMNILRLATTQIVYLNIANYSVVNGFVNLVKKIRPGYENLVNGILRNICRNRSNLIETTQTIKNLPNWIRLGWEKSLSPTIVKSISKSLINIPKTDINIKKKAVFKKNWEKELGGKFIFDNILRLNKTKQIKNLIGYDNGDWWVQNAAASIPVKVIEKFFFNKNDVSVLEVGSSPGGKTMQLIDAGFNVTALEKSENRFAKLQENLRRVNYSCSLMKMDIENFKTKNNFDCCLLDISCSASGIVARKPEILLSNKSVKQLIVDQENILNKASKLNKKNGIIVYCVCSLIYEEGENQIKIFLNKNKKFKKIGLEKYFTKKFDFHFKNGDIMTLPINYKDMGGLDGFFISCLQKYE